MARKDVRDYYFSMLAQYLEEKENLSDFEDALKSGHITEERMQEALEIVDKLEENYHRLTYIMYLLDMPNKKAKKDTYSLQNKTVVEALKKLGADENSIKKENFDALKHFKLALSELNSEIK